MKSSSELSRRAFLKASTAVAGLSLVGSPVLLKGASGAGSKHPGKIGIAFADANFEREALVRPFGFKGGYMSEIWQTMAMLESTSGARKVGLCTQNVLWSDAKVFADHSESGGNALMFALSERALQLAEGRSFDTPVDLLDGLLDEVYEYGKALTGNPHLRKTFALNALVGLDNAAWLLYAHERGITDFDELIPAAYKPALSYQHEQVASIPLMAYSIPIDEIVEAVEQGYFFMKIKIGQPGTQQEMLEKDKARLSAIHEAIGHVRTHHTQDGKLPYYFDANGRYEDKATLLSLLGHAEKIGALDQIALIEEPFPEELEVEVGDMGVRIAADESAHTDEDAVRRIEMGYQAIALKAIAKTMSMTMKIAQAAHERGVPCFCADLTVNPILVDWNKAVAARLAPFPGLGLGLLETNGHQNYRGWERMVGYHPYAGAPWTQTVDGVFKLDDDYWAKSGGILTPSPHYEAMFERR
ncbi:MAG: twin-arginine translocation signal domain-containing protein [Xanthomonadales bacterium]|nr:twin-arginine translocation signal domain-containing protein [Xanthomonadales bacterium]NIX13804.1 twin-arginine translocation signal domain-containing protein [Xanthomonadales bacterium]